MAKPFLLGMALCIALAAAARAPLAQPQHTPKMATWNLAWMLDKESFDRWTAACDALGWAESASPQDPTLPYCDVHSGMAWPLRACLRNRAGGEPPRRDSRYPVDHACRTSKDLRSWVAYQEKIATVQRVSRQLKDAGVMVVALQEVTNAEAARLAFPESDGWQVLTSAEVKGVRPHRIAQHVGVAYQRHAGIKQVEVMDDLAVQGKDGRYTRPGLSFTMPIKGRDTTWLVVHLKAGCRSQRISEPGPARKYPDDRAEPVEEYTARDQRLQADCWAFRQQVPVIEQWLDAQLRRGRQYVGIVGDFNRAILNELGKPARTNSQESASSPITSDTNIARLLPELSDGNPVGARLTVVRPNYAGVSQREVCGTRRGTQGIDMFLLSSELARLLQGKTDAPARLTSSVMAFGDAAYGRDIALVSDHCPHLLDIGNV